MQYSIFVLPGPEKAWHTLKSSWYWKHGYQCLVVSRVSGSRLSRVTHQLLVYPLQLLDELVVELTVSVLAHSRAESYSS